MDIQDKPLTQAYFDSALDSALKKELKNFATKDDLTSMEERLVARIDDRISESEDKIIGMTMRAI